MSKLVSGEEPYNEIIRYWAVGVYKTEGAYCPLLLTISVMMFAVAALFDGVDDIILFDIITGGDTFVGWIGSVFDVKTIA